MTQMLWCACQPRLFATWEESAPLNELIAVALVRKREEWTGFKSGGQLA